MAKRKLTDSQLTSPELRAREAHDVAVRARTLTTWYNNANNSTDTETRLNAQAKLGLQLRMRETRSQRIHLTTMQKFCKKSGDTSGAAQYKYKAIPVFKKLRILYALRENFPNGSKSEWAKEWQKEFITLEDLLEHEELDLKADFLIGHDVHTAETTELFCVDASSHEERTDATTLDEELESVLYQAGYEVSLEESDVEDKECDTSASIVFDQDKDKIWDRHEQTMRGHFEQMGFLKHVIDNRIAIQKKEFILQAEQECFVYQNHVSPFQCFLYNRDHFDDSQFIPPKNGLWTLSSTKLWQVCEGSDNWKQPNWTPGGHLRISTVDNISHVHLDFGSTCFVAGPVEFRSLVSQNHAMAVASSDRVPDWAKFEIFFLGNSSLGLWCPVNSLFPEYGKCGSIPLTATHIWFVGVYEGNL
ncbi:hypothetical protein B0J11DRAFT_588103 [Dendryphion nanum]|uniref:Uncharacterized protein n=1 Tax=Dendryphion nanum TaxID=256645 RepID=A0A9P9EFR5_9PLEO|nr:hypothetical protein B0J11DRAFT_588103 [Dendryphion nanum]